MLNPRSAFNRLRKTISEGLREVSNEQLLLHAEYSRIKREISLSTPGNPALYGYKVYSQFDEDGILAHIFSRIGSGNCTFIEIGCSDGLENNTHALLLLGWQGVWIDADARKIRNLLEKLPSNQQLVIRNEFVFSNNVSRIVSDALESLGAISLDLLSIDIDGDDLNVLTTILQSVRPRVICAEYNAKFPPPIDIQIKANNNSSWQRDDYQGASLFAYTESLKPLGYKLITCGLSGVNAFFVQESDSQNFPDFSPEELFQEARYYFSRYANGHRPSLKFLIDRLSADDRLTQPRSTL